MSPFENFTDFIKERLILDEMNLLDLSKAIPLNYSILYDWMSGTSRPSMENLIKLANHYDVSLDYVFGLTEVYEINKSQKDEDFCDRLKALLEKHKISPYRLAKSCRIEKSTLSKWLMRKTVPKPEKALVIARFFNVSFDYLIGRED